MLKMPNLTVREVFIFCYSSRHAFYRVKHLFFNIGSLYIFVLLACFILKTMLLAELKCRYGTIKCNTYNIMYIYSNKY